MNTQTEIKLKPGHWVKGIESKADLDASIIKNGGSELSRATMLAEDLIPAFCEYLEGFDVPWFEGLIEEATEALSLMKSLEVGEKYWESKVYQEAQCDVDYLLNESLFDALNMVAPDNYVFSSHPSEGASYGFWPAEEF